MIFWRFTRTYDGYMAFENLVCAKGHEMQDGDQFCAMCGSERARTECPECGSEIREGAVFCVKCGHRLITESTSLEARQHVLTPRSNHEAIWHAVNHLANTGQVLSTGQIIDLVQKFSPGVTRSSILPNDHAIDNHNAWACRCTRGEGGMSPIFKQEDRGRYRVLSRSAGGLASNPSTPIIPTDLGGTSPVAASQGQGIFASKWLRDRAVQALQSPTSQVRVLRGSRGGKWLAVGADLPALGPLKGREPAFAIGMNRDNDFVLGQPPNGHVIYLGIRCNGYLPWGPATDLYELVKATVSEFPWQQKDQYWPVWFEPSPLKEDEMTPLSAEHYVVKFKNTFERLYPRIIDAIEGRWGKSREWEDSRNPATLTVARNVLAHSFGDNIRRKIYLFLKENPGATADELAEHCGVHANVVRHHLERLTEGGYVTFDNVGETAVDRPVKCYTVMDIGSEV